MTKFKECVAVVTGAGSGIGRQLSYQLAAAGAKIAISDINQKNLDETEQHLRESGADVLATTLDVSNKEAVFTYAQQVDEHFGKVNLVINNAGVALASGSLWDTELEDFDWVMNINFYGVLYGTKAFLPKLQQADWGHIVNISSLFGLISVPTQAAYNSSKFAVRGLTEALRHELKAENSKVSCTSVHPGGIKTNIARDARIADKLEDTDAGDREQAAKRFEKLAKTTAESAAQQILQAVADDKMRLLIGSDAKMIDRLQRFFPSAYGKFLQRFIYSKGKF